MKHLGQLPDLPGRRLDVWVVIAAVALQDLFRVLSDLLELLVHGVEPLDQAGLVLQLGEDGLGPDDNIPDSLAGDAIVLSDLAQGQVLVVIEVIKFLLAVSEHIAIKIIEHGHAISLTFHRS